MIANSHTSAQTQLLLAQANSTEVRYVFSTQMSKVMLMVNKDKKGLPLSFNNSEIEYSKKETHLGLVRIVDGKTSEAIAERIQVR